MSPDTVADADRRSCAIAAQRTDPRRSESVEICSLNWRSRAFTHAARAPIAASLDRGSLGGVWPGRRLLAGPALFAFRSDPQ